MKNNLIWVSLLWLPLTAVGGNAITERADPQLALTVENPSGARYRLLYTDGQGWRLVDLPSRTTVVKIKSDPILAPLDAPTSSEIHPLTVFIDGPTGYTFVWVAEGGWKFVGNIATVAR